MQVPSHIWVREGVDCYGNGDPLDSGCWLNPWREHYIIAIDENGDGKGTWPAEL